MQTNRAGQIVPGLLLVLLGLIFLALQLFPGISRILSLEENWPLIVIAVGAVLFILGIATRSYELAVPASIVSGVGAILLYQNITNDWGSWAYAWTLIPGFVGFGVMINGLLNREKRSDIRGGATLMFISAAMFLVFGSFMGPLQSIGLWPVLLILGGVMLLVGAFRK